MVLISGTSRGIGREIALLFLERGYEVTGVDILPSAIENDKYHHIVGDIRDSQKLPEIEDVEILINNAGVQNSEDDIDVNLKGTMAFTERYAFHEGIKSVVFNASSSGHTGFEFGAYSASKAGILGYMKHCAWRLASFHATCNSLSFGGVITPLNDTVMQDETMWNSIMEVTPLKKWTTAREAAEWFYFLSVINQSCSGQDILVDNGEKDLNCTFVWPEFHH